MAPILAQRWWARGTSAAPSLGDTRTSLQHRLGTTAKIFDGSAVRERITSCFISRTQRELVPLLSLQSIAITQSRVMAKDDPRLPLLEKQQQDLYREAIQRSGRPWKAIAGKAVNRLKRPMGFRP